ncbi:MAG: hypothetical protein U0525_00380 [Patescibacteria group bacterium]
MTKNQKILSIGVGIIFIIGFIFFLGQFRYFSNPLSRNLYKEYFISEVIKNKRIDAEKFWEFRDFYAATTSTFRPENIPNSKPFFVLSSGNLQSLDFLLSPNDRNTKTFVIPNDAEVILKSSNELIYKRKGKVYIKFVKEMPEMLKANGFFGYFQADLKKYQGYLWYNETVINK